MRAGEAILVMMGCRSVWVRGVCSTGLSALDLATGGSVTYSHAPRQSARK